MGGRWPSKFIRFVQIIGFPGRGLGGVRIPLGVLFDMCRLWVSLLLPYTKLWSSEGANRIPVHDLIAFAVSVQV
jgi:hypothetical protein